MSKPDLRILTAPVSSEFETMTFPVYRPLLKLEPRPLHPEMGDNKLVQPLAIGAFLEDKPVGLVLAETPVKGPSAPGSRDPEMLSLFCHKGSRDRGVGRALVTQLEKALAERGFARVHAVYMTGKPSIAAVESILRRRRWSPPVARTVTVRFTPDEAAATPWFGVRFLEPDYEIFPWKELTPEERAEIERSHKESPWISEGLEPWLHDRYGFDPVSSLGLRYKGEVVGWVINHRLSADRLRFTCSFVRKPLGSRGRIFPVFSASIARAREAGYRHCLFITPVRFKTMVKFIERRCKRWAGFVGETRGSTKELAGKMGKPV